LFGRSLEGVESPHQFSSLVRGNLNRSIVWDAVPQGLDDSQPVENRQRGQFGKGLVDVDHGFILPGAQCDVING